jgi:hypothetical protein
MLRRGLGRYAQVLRRTVSWAQADGGSTAFPAVRTEQEPLFPLNTNHRWTAWREYKVQGNEV